MAKVRSLCPHVLQTTGVFIAFLLLFFALPMCHCRPVEALQNPPLPYHDYHAIAEGCLSLRQQSDPYLRIVVEPFSLQLDEISQNSRSIAQRLGEGVRFIAPLDLATQYRVPIDFCADYWPEHDPGKTLPEFCADDYYYGWQPQLLPTKPRPSDWTSACELRRYIASAQ